MECTAKPEDMDCPDCSICTDPITAETGQVKLACSHTFHLACIGRWTTRGSSTCPLCRTELGDKERIEDDAVSSVSFSYRIETPPRLSTEYLAENLGMTRGRAQIYVDTFNGDVELAIEYVRYIRTYRDEPFYIPPLERIHQLPVLPNRDYFRDQEFGRKRHWLRYRKNVDHYLDRGYDTE